MSHVIHNFQPQKIKDMGNFLKMIKFHKIETLYFMSFINK